MCNIGSWKVSDNLNPFNAKGALTPARSLQPRKNFSDLKESMKKVPTPPTPIAPIAPATPMDSSVLQTEQDVRRAALRRRGTLATIFGGDTGGFNGPSVAGGAGGGQTLGG